MASWEWLSQPWAERWALVLLHFVWQGVLVAGCFELLMQLGRPRRAQTRYILALGGMALLAISPLATLFVLANQPRDDAPTVDALAVSDPAPRLQDAEAFAGSTPLADEGASSAERSPAMTPSSSTPDWLTHLQPWLLGAWMGGVVLLGLRLMLGCVGVEWLKSRCLPVTGELHERLDGLRNRLGVRGVRVMQSTRVGQALAVGFWRPMVLLPAAWLAELPVDVLEAVVAHELAHIRRFDLWVNLVQRMLETLLFYHPAVWWMSARVRDERELCCDELAVLATGRRAAYAGALELVARRRATAQGPALAAAIGGSRMNLLKRVRNVLGMAPRRERASLWPVGLAAIVLPVGIWLAAGGLLVGDEPRGEQKEGGERVERRDGDAPREGEVRRDGERREGEVRRDGDAPRREGDAPRDGERREGEVRRDGDREQPRREGEVRRDGDREQPRRDGEPRREGEPRRDGEVRREGDGFRPAPGLTPREAELLRLLNELRGEVAALRREVNELRGRGVGPDRLREGDRPREGFGPREGDRPREGVGPREGDRPRESDRPRDGQARGEDEARRRFVEALNGAPRPDGERREGGERPAGAPPRDR